MKYFPDSTYAKTCIMTEELIAGNMRKMGKKIYNKDLKVKSTRNTWKIKSAKKLKLDIFDGQDRVGKKFSFKACLKLR